MKLTFTPRFKKIIFFTAIFAGVLLVDLLTKYLTDGHGVSIHNTGIAFGLFSNARIFFIVTNLILTLFAVVAWYLICIDTKLKSFSDAPAWVKLVLNIGFALFIGGAVGNLYDRFVFGYVRDFISLPFFPTIFNFADLSLTVGTIALVTAFIFGTYKGTKVDNAA